MSMHDEINGLFPVRKTKAQKEAFRQWVTERARQTGWDVKMETGWMLGKSHNVVVGDPEQAQVIVTAHYDTPAVMPLPNFITPRNVGLYLLYQVAVMLLIIGVPVFLVCTLASRLGADFLLCYWLGLIVYFAIFLLMMIGPANRHNANDNTSGVASVLELMERLPQEVRGKAAFILFDNEEKGMLGSGSYARRHKKVRREKLLINLDCVGVGDAVLFFAKKKTRALPEWKLLEESFAAVQGKKAEFYPLEKSMYPSDQAQFDHGVAVCACRRGRRIGWYCSKIHTKEDTLCEQDCLDLLCGGLQSFIMKLQDAEGVNGR
ncbi:MAG: M28 family peptidase [Clostridia bacterium]|nr:M28 family peptidase [Clostridia bacterium]